MTETAPGPGWWLASDGRWYSPDQQPDWSRMSATTSSYGAYPPYRHQKTSGLAIASLIASLVWLSGLGSLVAVVLGFVARHDIKRSNGTTTGDGFAIAGIAFGFVGLGAAAIAVALIVGVAATVDHEVANPFATTTLIYGSTARISPSDNDGVEAITVYSVTPARSLTVPIGTVQVARLRFCTGEPGTAAAGILLVTEADLRFATTPTTRLPSFTAKVDGRGPNLAAVDRLAPNRCRTGYLAFPSTGRQPLGFEISPMFHGVIDWVP